MYRGDDLYLFDYWPVDNLNTVGAGAGFRRGENDFALHAGLNRLDDPYQYQTQLTPARGLGPPIEALVLDRPRVIASAKYTRYLHFKDCPAAGAKLALYAELHYLSDGDRPIVDQDRVEHLPSDYGWVAGAQLGLWKSPFNFVNLFFRYAGGLAAYGDLTAPQAVDPEKRVAAAREWVAALSANVELHRLGIMSAAYVRQFTDPAPDPFDPRSYLEYDIALRPQVYLTGWLHVATELSIQERVYNGFDPYLNRRLSPVVARASLLPIISPAGKGT
jgi:maltoporin